MSNPVVLVTGATGFVGQALCEGLLDSGIKFLPVMRTGTMPLSGATIVRNIQPSTDWRADLENVEAVVHLAGRVHIMRDSAFDPLSAYKRANVDATMNLASQCAVSGVRRFVYLSSIKVNGELTTVQPFSESDIPAPEDPYGISKHEAELGLRKLSQETGLEVVIIRPPLVYGPRVKANFLQLMRWVHRGIPLPLASVDNRRSMVYAGNLVDLIIRCLTHDAAPGRTFLVSDDHDVSVAELVRHLAGAMGRRPMLFPLPQGALRLGAQLVGKGQMAGRLLDSLQVDIELTKRVLQWTPPYSFVAGIETTVRHFLDAERASFES